MKAWSENLFTWVPNEDKDRLNRALHVLIFYPSENYFDRNLRQSYVEFQHIPIFATYINFRWPELICLGENCYLDLRDFLHMMAGTQ